MQNVSFIISNYNAQNTIDKCIESVLKQKYKGKIEIIVIDDFSKDNSLNIIKKYKVKLIKNEKNLGLARSLNKAIKQTKYDLLCIIWCDCILVNNNWLADMVKSYNKNKKSFIGSKLILPKEYWNEFSFYNKVVLTKDYEISLKNKQKEGRPTLFSKKVLLEVGLYDDKTFRIAGEDTDLRWKLQNKGHKLITADASMLHLDGFKNSSFKNHLLKKALPLAEASGVNFAKYGLKSFSNKYWNPMISTILYIFLFVPYINKMFLIIILFLILNYTLKVFKYTKDLRIIFVPLFKFLKDIITIIGFWKGFVTRKQEF